MRQNVLKWLEVLSMSRSSMIVEPPFRNALRHQRHEGERCQQRGDGKGPDEIILVVENIDMQRQGIGQAPDVARNNRYCTEIPHCQRVAEQHAVEQSPTDAGERQLPEG